MYDLGGTYNNCKSTKRVSTLTNPNENLADPSKFNMLRYGDKGTTFELIM